MSWWPSVWMVVAMCGLNVGARLPMPWSDVLFWPSFVAALGILVWSTGTYVRSRV